MTFPDTTHVWPEWKIEKQIGRGTFGTVWQALRESDTITSRAAIKRISIPQDPYELEALQSDGLDLHASRTYLKRIVDDFVNEIRLMESFKGIQNIVSIEDYKVIEHTDVLGWDIYIRMELLTPFSTYLCDKTLTEAEVIDLGIDICTALEYCARRNIIHRDIKPENIFVNSFGSFKLGDFGTARQMESLTGGLSQKGTFNYMAPEVIRGHSYDARVDVYSLGLVLYRLLNGNRLPFISEKQLLSPSERRNAFDRRIRGDRIPPPANASDATAAVILKACAFRPEDRFESAAQMRRALLSLSLGKETAPAPVRKVPETPAKPKRVPAPKVKPAAPIRVDAPEMVFSVPEAPKPRKKAPRKEDGIRIDSPEMVFSTPEAPKTRKRAPRKADEIRIDSPEMVLHTPEEKRTSATSGKNPWLRTILTAALILALFAAAGGLIRLYRVQPISLEIVNSPEKTVYALGETLQIEGLYITVTDRNGNTKHLSGGYTLDVSELNTPGQIPVTVHYQGLTASFPVQVASADTASTLSVHTLPDRTSYLDGTRFDSSGLTLKVQNSDGTSKIVKTGFYCSPITVSGEGHTTITASYSGMTVDIPVEVYTVTGLEIDTPPTQRDYTAGDRIKTAGLAVTVFYSNGKSERLDSGYTCTPSRLFTEGETTVSVSYAGASDSFTVNVAEDPEDTIENFRFPNLSVRLGSFVYEEGLVGYNDNNFPINWLLTISYNNSEKLFRSYTQSVSCSWVEKPEQYVYIESAFQNAKAGTTVYDTTYVFPSEYRSYAYEGLRYNEYCLPDDPSLEGPQWVHIKMGSAEITIHFELVYQGNYSTGTGWGIRNIRYE